MIPRAILYTGRLSAGFNKYSSKVKGSVHQVGLLTVFVLA